MRIAAAALVVLATLVPRLALAQAALENPQPASVQSGIGLVSGWKCNAAKITIVFDALPALDAAYGTSRNDTQATCGDANNGFGLLINWNLLGDGPHTVHALADGVEFASATFSVQTFGVEFLTGVTGSCSVADFPAAGETTSLVWQESSQNFVIANSSASAMLGASGASIATLADAGPAALENPQPNSSQSGIGLVSGWKCAASTITIGFDSLPPLDAAYGTSRNDTQTVCGDANNGFGLLINWNLLGDGPHTVHAFADGVEFASATFNVATLGGEFLTGLEGTCSAPDFPSPGDTTNLAWQESSQNFVVTSQGSSLSQVVETLMVELQPLLTTGLAFATGTPVTSCANGPDDGDINVEVDPVDGTDTGFDTCQVGAIEFDGDIIVSATMLSFDLLDVLTHPDEDLIAEYDGDLALSVSAGHATVNTGSNDPLDVSTDSDDYALTFTNTVIVGSTLTSGSAVLDLTDSDLADTVTSLQLTFDGSGVVTVVATLPNATMATFHFDIAQGTLS